jgi:hypothetical protein
MKAKERNEQEESVEEEKQQTTWTSAHEAKQCVVF